MVAKGDGVFDGNRSAVDWINNNPSQRDTIRVDAEGYAIIRFR
jgi:iron transport multicopper oxidase